MPIILEGLLILAGVAILIWLFVLLFTVISKSKKTDKVASWMNMADSKEEEANKS